MKAKKFNMGKNRLDLLPFDALEEIGKVLTYGAKKYAPDAWRKVPNAKTRYEAALLRHLSAYKRGEQFDEESGLSHISHAACNALFLIYFELKEGNK
jgi:hypothetical protein